MAKVVSKFFRVAVEGKTVDGRVLTKDRLEEMGGSYNPEVYGARVWVEHLRGFFADSAFSAKGDVIEAKTEVIADGPLKGKTALFARIAPSPELIEMNRAGKKIYPSIEIDPEFSTTGGAYLRGLAVCDEPASIGTEQLAFSAKSAGDTGNMMFSDEETMLEFETVEDAENSGSKILETIKELFSRKDNATAERDEKTDEAVKLIADEVVKVDQKFSKSVAGKVDQAAFDELGENYAALKKELGDLISKLDVTEKKENFNRDPAEGSERTKAKY